MELNREQIVTVLKCCASPKQVCGDCPMPQDVKDDCRCMEVISRNTLALIRELTEENNKLTINMNAYGLTAKRLAEENGILASLHKTACDAVKIDTLRKMQSEIKGALRGICKGDVSDFCRLIDVIAKRLLEEGK